jgi:hypothetical protein
VQIKSLASDPGGEDEEGRTIVVIGHMVNPDRISVSPDGELDIGFEDGIDWNFTYDSPDRTDLLAHMRDGRAQCLLIGIEAETVSTLRTAWFMAIIREGETASRIGLARVRGQDLERKAEELKSKGVLLQTANLVLVLEPFWCQHFSGARAFLVSTLSGVSIFLVQVRAYED